MPRFREFCKDPLICIANYKWLLLATFLVTILIGAIGYNAFEPVLWYQALEWSAQTVTSTGYGNYPATTMAGSLWSTAVMLWGVPVMLSLVVGFVVDSVRKRQTKKSEDQINEIMCETQAIIKHFNILVDYSETGSK